VLYIKDSNEEYGIPFNQRDDILSIENGKLYKIDDLITILKKDMSYYNNNGEKKIGGLLTQSADLPTKSNSSVIFYAVLVGVLVLGLIAFIAFRKKHQHVF
jgi:hypothetical protein